jgi:hypothetical protein
MQKTLEACIPKGWLGTIFGHVIGLTRGDVSMELSFSNYLI